MWHSYGTKIMKFTHDICSIYPKIYPGKCSAPFVGCLHYSRTFCRLYGGTKSPCISHPTRGLSHDIPGPTLGTRVATMGTREHDDHRDQAPHKQLRRRHPFSTTMGRKYPLKRFDSQWPFPMGIWNYFITIFGKDCLAT